MGRGPSISNYERYVHFKLCLIKGRSLSIPTESTGIPEFWSIPVDSIGISGIPVNSSRIRRNFQIPVESVGISRFQRIPVEYVGE